MTSRRFLILCTSFSLIFAAGCVDGGSDNENQNTGSDTTVIDSGATVDTVAPVDAGETPEADVAVEDVTPIADTAVIEDVSVTEDAAVEEDATTEEDASLVDFGDGLTVPAPGIAGCDNKDDIVLLSEGADGLTETMKDCALKCLGEKECATDCVIKELGVSDDCAGCFGENISCTMKNCALNCMDPNNPKCLECQEENCNGDFVECAGITIPGS